jgi:hypothetical protein
LAIVNNVFDPTPPSILSRLKTVSEIIAGTIAAAALVLATVSWIEDRNDSDSVAQKRSLSIYSAPNRLSVRVEHTSSNWRSGLTDSLPKIFSDSNAH